MNELQSVIINVYLLQVTTYRPFVYTLSRSVVIFKSAARLSLLYIYIYIIECISVTYCILGSSMHLPLRIPSNPLIPFFLISKICSLNKVGLSSFSNAPRRRVQFIDSVHSSTASEVQFSFFPGLFGKSQHSKVKQLPPNIFLLQITPRLSLIQSGDRLKTF